MPAPPVPVTLMLRAKGRRANARALPSIAGHPRGAEALRPTVPATTERCVRYLTLFSFSTEIWKRPGGEVSDLIGLLRVYLRAEVAELHRNGVRIRIIGDRTRFSPDIVTLIVNAEELTRDNTRLTLVVALSYGGRDDILHAVRKLAAEAAAGRRKPEEIDAACFADHLFTAGIPDPDLLIRTSGEQRISNFLLWQLAYTELVFTETLWPDFGESDLEKAVQEFHGRDRRYGASFGSR